MVSNTTQKPLPKSHAKFWCVTACAKWHPSSLEEPLVDEPEQYSSEEEKRDIIDSQKQPENELQSSQEMDMK